MFLYKFQAKKQHSHNVFLKSASFYVENVVKKIIFVKKISIFAFSF